MAYSDLIKTYIEKSKLTHKEIAIKCKEMGKSIDPSYISKLVNGKIDPPSDDVSRVIAKVCGGNENILILEAYLEKAPKPLLDFLTIIRFARNSMNFLQVLDHQDNDIDEKKTDQLLEDFLQKLDTKPISEFILETNSAGLVETAKDFIKLEARYYNNIDKVKLRESLSNNPDSSFDDIVTSIAENTVLDYLPVIEDDSMLPDFPKGSKALIYEKTYSNGDIVGFWSNDYKKIQIRKYFRENDTTLLLPINTDFEPIIYNNSDANIVGKVSKMIVPL